MRFYDADVLEEAVKQRSAEPLPSTCEVISNRMQFDEVPFNGAVVVSVVTLLAGCFFSVGLFLILPRRVHDMDVQLCRGSATVSLCHVQLLVTRRTGKVARSFPVGQTFYGII